MFMRTTAEAWDLPGAGARPLHPTPPSAEPVDALVGADTRRLEAAIAQTTALLTGRLAEVDQPFSGTTPAALAEAFDGLDLDRPLPSLGTALQEISRLYLRDAIYFHHPRYMAHLNCPVAWPAVAAELIAATVNSSVDTWDQSAGGTHIEQALIDWTAGRIGLPAATADGVFTSGGTQSNLMALLLARDNYCLSRLGHDVQRAGLPPQARRFRIFASEASHFSLQKAAAVLGLGAEAIVPVACDAHYRLDPAALAAAVDAARAAGQLPIAVVTTLGTTNFGSLDPIAELAPWCAREGLWLHADAAYGCGLLVSRRHRHQLAGIEQADSVTVDYHKSFLQPVSCSALLVRQRRDLACLTYHADYLNPLSQTRENTPNLVCKSLQTTRRFDALKLWLTLRVLGPDALGEAFDAVIALAGQVHGLLAAAPDFEPLHAPALSTLLFRYRPPGAPPAVLDDLNEAIRKALFRDGRAVIASTREAGHCYLKFTLLNPAATLADVEAVLAQIRQAGESCLRALHPAAAGAQRAGTA